MHEHVPSAYDDDSDHDTPTVSELMKHTNKGLGKRALTRLLFTTNPERSVRIHERLGTPIIRKVVMGTAGRVVPRVEGLESNYHLNTKKSKIDAAISFATKGSVYNETIHGVLAVMAGSLAVNNYLADLDTSAHINMGSFGFNMALVALQRYNRARMLNRVNEELANGETFSFEAENWTGVDASAVDNFEEARDEQPMPSTSSTRWA